MLSFANAGATSLFTTAGDLARWLTNFETKSVGGEEAITTLLQKGKLLDGTEIDYALGVVHGKYRGLPTLSHGGSDAGFRSMVVYFPKQQLGVVVLANVPTVDPGTRAGKVAAIFLGDQMEPLPAPKPAEAPTSDQPESTAETANSNASPDAETLDHYVGRYRLEEGGVVLSLFRREDQLFADVPGVGEIELVARSGREFSAAKISGSLLFEVPVDGAARSLEVTVAGQKVIGVRVTAINGLDLETYAGWYFSPELETFYRFSVVEDGLRASHIRNAEILLIPVAEDKFQGDAWFFGEVSFTRTADEITGFRLSGGRIRNLQFLRVDPPPLGLR